MHLMASQILLALGCPRIPSLDSQIGRWSIEHGTNDQTMTQGCSLELAHRDGNCETDAERTKAVIRCSLPESTKSMQVVAGD